MKPSPAIQILLTAIEEGYRRQAWHGTNLKGSVRGLSASDAVWSPSHQRHSIQEIIIHCAYWKYAVRRRIRGEKRGSFPRKGSNWFGKPAALTNAAWREDVALLDQMHAELLQTVATLNTADLDKKTKGSKIQLRKIISGIAMHDVYHAGQIQLIKRLMNDRSDNSNRAKARR